ncbi:putative phosphatidate phosphatase [Neocloeon triangulifer]|uniref:putative phosphatidate phosphatase n=1 Tax=Neocloeon triangulifer TaxID=2078957 RepID=UPI00286F9A74|nr:putative phosphatidate phosphatase [Neocloeon triangulifer]
MAKLIGFLGRSVLVDWGVLVAEGITVLLVPLFSSPTLRGFSCSDSSIRLPYLGDTIPTWALGVGFIVGGLALMVLLEIFLSTPGPSGVLCRGRALPVWLVQLYSVITAFLCGAGFSQITTDIAKYHVGALRPHFYQLCDPGNLCESVTDPFKYFYPGDGFENYQCKGWDLHRIKEARLSFPSGHASLSFYVSTYLIFYFHSRLRDCKTQRALACFIVRPFIQGLALLAAWFTAVSRVMDNMHHWRDVTAGGLIGITAAVLIVQSLKPFKDVRCLKPNEESPLRHLQAGRTGLNDIESNSN